jgi:hypothetical protein
MGHLCAAETDSGTDRSSMQALQQRSSFLSALMIWEGLTRFSFIKDDTQESQSGGSKVRIETKKMFLVVRGRSGVTRELRFSKKFPFHRDAR